MAFVSEWGGVRGCGGGCEGGRGGVVLYGREAGEVKARD